MRIDSPEGASTPQSQATAHAAAPLGAFRAAVRDPSRPDPNAPLPVKTGDVNYYRNRLADFQRRNPGMTPPAYYREYGDKYAQRFASLGPADLSPEGLAWRDRTLKALQEAIEQKRRDDPAGFAALERNPEAFKAFAYATHPAAYVKSGLFNLSAQDLAVIAMTPDIKDVLSQDGLKGWLDTVKMLRPKDAAHILGATVLDRGGMNRVVFDYEKKVWKALKPIVSGPWRDFPVRFW